MTAHKAPRSHLKRSAEPISKSSPLDRKHLAWHVKSLGSNVDVETDASFTVVVCLQQMVCKLVGVY